MSDLIRVEIMAQAAREVWAILPAFLETWLANPELELTRHAEQPRDFAPESTTEARSDTVEVAEDEQQAISKISSETGRIARIPIIGAISRRDSFWSMFFGGTSIERLTKSMREVAADETISTVLLDIDSPGGVVSGLPELAAEVRKLKESKRVVALANSLTASAAYWIASQADEIVATPEALVGSVGVFMLHEDWSKLNDRIGVKPTYIFAGQYKVEGNADEPLSDTARAHMQSIVDDSYSLFINDVAKGRGVTPAAVKADYGKGRVLTAKTAKAAGMVDYIAGANETMRRLMGVKAEANGQPQGAAPTDGVNSQARTALMRRRLELAHKYFEEEQHG